MKNKKIHKPEELFGTERVYEYFKIKGKYYKYDAEDGKTVLKEVSKKYVYEHIKKARELAKKLKENLDAETILMGVFMEKYDKEHLDGLYKTVFKSKRKYKPKTRGGYCVDMKIGNHIIPIIGD